MLGSSADEIIEDLRGVPQHYLNHRVRDFLIDLVEDYCDLKDRVIAIENALMEEEDTPNGAEHPRAS